MNLRNNLSTPLHSTPLLSSSEPGGDSPRTDRTSAAESGTDAQRLAAPLALRTVWSRLLMVTVLLTAFAVPNTLFAQGSGSLDDLLVNLGPATEAEVRVIAAGQASDQAGPKYPSVAVERRTFTGLFTPASAMTQLAIFSDDGCDITVDGTQIHSRLNQGQALPDLGQSFHLVTPQQPWVAGQSYVLRVDYSNTFYQGLTDIDGATLFAFNGGGKR